MYTNVYAYVHMCIPIFIYIYTRRTEAHQARASGTPNGNQAAHAFRRTWWHSRTRRARSAGWQRLT